MLIKKKETSITISLKSFSDNTLKLYISAFFAVLSNHDITFKVMPTTQKHLTLLRSPHKYKKAQEHFELNIHKASITVNNIDLTKLFLILTNKPQGIFINLKIKENIK